MSGSLKDENSLRLYGLMAANLFVFFGFIQGGALVHGDLPALARDLDKALPAGLGLALTAIVSAQLTADAKSRVIFMRWRNPLPGCEAFSRLAASDPRIDQAALERKYGPLPTLPRDQNTLWYRLYKSVESEPAVVQIHRAFLFARDYACLSLMMVVLLGVASAIQIPELGRKATYLSLLVLQSLVAGQAARNNGRRFVTTVLAIKASQP